MQLPLVLFSHKFTAIHELFTHLEEGKQVEMPRDSVPHKQVIAELEF